MKEMECPNIYCPHQENNECENYIGLPMICNSRDKYIRDNCPTEEEFNNTLEI